MRDVWFCLGSGPSQCREDIDAIRGRGTVVAINNQVFDAPWADILFTADRSWFEWYGNPWKSPDTAAILSSFRGERVSSDRGAQKYGFKIVRKENGEGLGRKGAVRTGCNSGYQVINLGFLRGFRTVVLTGFDMQHTEGRHHNHADHPQSLGNFAVGMPALCQRKFPRLAEDLHREGVRVINCSRETALTCFERMPLSKALAVL